MASSTRSYKRTTLGAYSHEVLAALYRYGAATRSQLSVMLGISEAAVDRQLRHLKNGKQLAVTVDLKVGGKKAKGGRGRAQNVYYLTAAGREAGAAAVGLENTYSSAAYKRVGLPRDAAHRILGNRYLLALQGEAHTAYEDGLSVEVDAEEVWSESAPLFPLFASGLPGASGGKHNWLAIEPDGTFMVAGAGFPASSEDCGQRYLLEVENSESGLRTNEAIDKVRRYGLRWRRILAPTNRQELRWHDEAARLEPIVIITSSEGLARRLHGKLRERVPHAEGWSEVDETVRENTRQGEKTFDPRRLVLVAGCEEASADPFGRVYRPLASYPADNDSSQALRQVSLADAAAVAARITPPATERVRERLEREAEAEKEVAS